MTSQDSTAPCKLTDVFVRGSKNITCKRAEIRDTTVTGLVLRVSPKNMKSFSLHTRTASGDTGDRRSMTPRWGIRVLLRQPAEGIHFCGPAW